MYDHFGLRAKLVLETTHYVEDLRGLTKRKQRFEAANTGEEALEAYIEFWGNFIPEIYSMARCGPTGNPTLPPPRGTSGWAPSEPVAGLSLRPSRAMATGWTVDEATNLLWSLLSMSNWEQLTIECRRTQEQYLA